MANEWTKVELFGANRDGEPRRMTVVDGTAVSQGTLLTLVSPRTVGIAAYSATARPFAGIAAEDHTASVGVTSINVWTQGIFEATCSGAIVLGQPISGSEGNYAIGTAAVIDPASGANVIGYALETGTADAIINVRLNL